LRQVNGQQSGHRVLVVSMPFEADGCSFPLNQRTNQENQIHATH
jgi:hypothetical protein